MANTIWKNYGVEFVEADFETIAKELGVTTEEVFYQIVPKIYEGVEGHALVGTVMGAEPAPRVVIPFVEEPEAPPPPPADPAWIAPAVPEIPEVPVAQPETTQE